MPTEVHKLIGTLHIGPPSPGGVDLSDQITAIGYPQTATRDAPVTVLTGDIIQTPAIYSWQLTGTLLLDLMDTTGAYEFIVSQVGAELPFSFFPIGATGPEISGTFINDGLGTEEINSGSLVTSKFTWPIQGQVTRTPAP
jgi:hypothetical protein